MKTSHIFFASALVITGTFFGILTIFELPESLMQWITSDVFLGMVLFMSYCIIAMQHNHSKSDSPTELPAGIFA